MTRHVNSPLKIAPKILGSIMGQAKTEVQIEQELGISNGGSVANWLAAFHAAGVIRIAGHIKGGNNVWTKQWIVQPMPFAIPDAVMPEYRSKRREGQGARVNSPKQSTEDRLIELADDPDDTPYRRKHPPAGKPVPSVFHLGSSL